MRYLTLALLCTCFVSLQASPSQAAPSKSNKVNLTWGDGAGLSPGADKSPVADTLAADLSLASLGSPVFSMHWQAIVEADLSQCIQQSDAECVRLYGEMYPGLVAHWSVQDRSSTRLALEVRRYLAPQKLKALAVLQILLDHGAPISKDDFIYASENTPAITGIQWPADVEVLKLLHARVEFLNTLRAVAEEHQQHNTKSENFVHWPAQSADDSAVDDNAADDNAADDSTAEDNDGKLEDLSSLRQALPPKNALVYQDTIAGKSWLQVRHAEGDVSLDDWTPVTSDPTARNNSTQASSEKPWQHQNWPAVVTPSEVHALATAIWQGDFNKVVDIVIKKPYVVHATPAQDINLIVPTNFHLPSLEQPAESFLGQALKFGHDEIARLLIEFQAELLPSENRPGRSEYIALQALKKTAGRIHMFWQAQRRAPSLSWIQNTLSTLSAQGAVSCEKILKN